MSLKKLVVACLVCGSVVLGTGATTFAGEITGNQKATNQYTPINITQSDSVAEPRAAECAFSGLEDDLAKPGETQTPHGFSAYDFYLPPGVAQACSYANNGNRPE